MTYDEVELRILALPADASALVAEPLTSQIDKDIATLLAKHRIIRFKGKLMIEVREPSPHFIPFAKDHFNRIAYPLLSPVKKSHVNELFWHLSHRVRDLSGNDHLVQFGSLKSSRAHLTIWDMDKLELRYDLLPTDCVRRSPLPLSNHSNEPIPIIMRLAGNKQGLYDDIMQSLAPLVMAKKPDGVIWWVGGDSDGKAVLIEALRRIFPDQLTSLTVQQLNGRRRTLGINDKLGNVTEDSGLISDTAIYKNIGTHESFNIHRYHSQNQIEVEGNVHHIFSTNSAPSFPFLNESIVRRTQIVPFERLAKGSPAHLPTAEFCSRLITEICQYAVRIQQHGYRYDWSPTTLAAKARSFPGGKRFADAAPDQPHPEPIKFCW